MLHSRNDSGSESVIREMGVCLRQNRNDAYFRRGLMASESLEKRSGWSFRELRTEKCGLCLRSSGASSEPGRAI